uniref:Contactin-associated protein-like 5 isoform X4 n=1 Tax=Crassostrea virginica TaxID=6565 RepID=A0A8B8CCM8_CRAVI|nr:contactin-associated protein-like 5 isoform X4 [Crassostrea virginica]
MEEKIIVSSTSRWLLLLLICALNGYLAQKNTDPNPNSGWTFSKQESFVAFSPNLTLEQDQEIMFSFRTQSPNGLLFCHLVEHFNQSVHPLLRNYHFCAELSHGFLQVKYSLNQISDVMNLGKALNDDSWHSVDIFLETTSGKLEVTLDDLPSTSIYLRAYTQFADVKAILDWTRLRSVVSFAGLTHAVAVDHHQFIGCLRSLKYRELIDVTWEVSPTIVMQATPGCQDLCQGENPCGEGRCVNLYTSVHCDCSLLDREGDKCQYSNITAVTLHGYEWLTYQLYSEEEKTLRDRNRFSLQFKSDRGSGVLLYAVGSIDAGRSLEQYHSHVIASVHQGTVKASVAFGDDILEQTMGIGVDDSSDGWHNLTIVHERVKVEFYLDGVRYVHETVNDMYYLGLDPIIYIGGGKKFVQTLGLQVRQNFVGCLKNVYINDHSVLYELRNNHSFSQLHGNTDIRYGCHRVANISLTFPKSKSFLYLSGYSDRTFSVQFDFRTVRETAILLSAKINTVDSFGYQVKGFFEVWINNTLPMIKFVRSMYYDSIANTTLLHVNVSDNQWHTLSFQLKDGQVKISVDNLSLPSFSTGNGSTLVKTIEIGYGYSRIYAEHEGFVGCIRNLVIQKQFLDPINLMERAPTGGYQSGLILDGCKLVNYCLVHQHCQHGGRCLSDWDGVSCDCSSSAYQGKYCQFSRYHQSCDSYFQSGWRRSGVYVIDVDGSGPVEPTYVSCQMGISTEGDYYGQTVVEHNLHNLTKVRGTTLPDIRLRLTYRGMGFVQLQQLTKTSAWCEQYVQYRCLNAPIGLGNLTNFKSIDGGVVQYIGEAGTAFTPGCSKGTCNCDDESLVAQEDSGFNRIKSQLPIGEVTVYQYTDFSTPDSRGTLTIGPLKCWGNTESLSSSSVTFVTEDSFLKLPGWVYGDLKFSFRTHQKQALLLYQSSSNGDWFKVTLEAEDAIKMEMQIKGKPVLEEILDADQPVNDGEWHRVTLELSAHEVRCGLDSQRRIVAIPFHNNITFDGLLYLGGKLYDHGSYHNLPGLAGCVKGLVYNGKLRNLTYDVYDDMPNILSGCRPRCSPDPCQNGARCVEMWNDYRCICTNEWAHSGQSCEININNNAVTVTGDSEAFFDLRVSSNPLEMEERIVFSFRTQMYRALIFYMYDELNNFIQLEVVESRKLRFTRNNFQQIFYKDIEVPGITQPTWKQVVLEPSKIIVDGEVTFLGLSNNKMETGYSTDPFANEEETVKPSRPAEKLPPFLRLYLGGTPANVTTLEKFTGCIRGFKIGDHPIDLQKNSQDIAGIHRGCKKGCNVNLCLNGGTCMERWGEGLYECDCSRSNFAGKQCELEASGIFTGQSVVHYEFVPYGEAAKTNTEQFSFIFKTNCSEKTMVMLMIFSKTKGDYIMISLSNRFVRALWKQGNNLFEEKLKGYFCTGTAHKFIYKRQGEEMWIKAADIHSIDQSDWRKKFTTRTYLENMNMVLVGGLIPELTINMEQKYGDSNQTVNFTGCISEVTYTPVKRESNIVIQPMKELRDLKNGSITVHGPEVLQCSPVDYHDPSQTTVPTTLFPTTSTHPTLGVTMPPWNIGGPRVYIIGKGNNITSPRPTTTTTPTTTTSMTTEPVITSAYFPTTEQGPTNVTLVLGQIITDTVSYITILIVSSVVTLMCLISVLIAVVMKRLRKGYVTYDVRKKYLDDFEMKEPLNHSMETYSPIPPPPKKDIHIATWDEFSMVSATLGPNKKKQNGIAPGKVHTLPADLKNTDYPVQTTFLPEDASLKYPVYNRKKNRPASSISEVLEEMERQQKAKELGVDPEQIEDPKSHGEGELEWDPLVDRTPLTLGIHHDTIYETQDEDSDGRSQATSSESEDPLKVLDQQEDLLHEYNGDSGYEAESQRNGEDDLDLGESLTPPTPDSSKLYYDITGVTESPKCPPGPSSSS